MSFSMTTDAVRRREKTVTRRLGWSDLKPGTLLWAVEKGMGLRKGEKVKKLALIRVVSNRPLTAGTISERDLRLEGFPLLTRDEFVEMFCKANRCQPSDIVNRIEFEYMEDGHADA